MNILMVTNTYLPFVGGISRSVQAFSAEYRKRGHRVLVVAPRLENTPENETDVVRLPAIQHFSGSDFSIRVPIPGLLTRALHDFRPDLIHSHHPFMLGDTALRIAEAHDLPLVFTHHTMYEHYTHYVPGDSPALKRFVVELSTGYANLCDRVIAPSRSIAEILQKRGVTTPMEVIPTGVDLRCFSPGDGAAFRTRHGINPDVFVVGHVGRLMPEKNLEFLARAVTLFLKRHSRACFLVVGRGSARQTIEAVFDKAGQSGQLLCVDVLSGKELAAAYHAMDVFAFASHSETQGIVLAEAMAAYVPVVAVDAPGVREMVRDGYNGRLLAMDDEDEFAAALAWVAALPKGERQVLGLTARQTAKRFSMARSASRALRLYQNLAGTRHRDQWSTNSLWSEMLPLIEAEWKLWVNRVQAAEAALVGKAG